jgi:hypothetical protein
VFAPAESTGLTESIFTKGIIAQPVSGFGDDVSDISGVGDLHEKQHAMKVIAARLIIVFRFISLYISSEDNYENTKERDR